jgi:hypothetical protein
MKYLILLFMINVSYAHVETGLLSEKVVCEGDVCTRVIKYKKNRPIELRDISKGTCLLDNTGKEDVYYIVESFIKGELRLLSERDSVNKQLKRETDYFRLNSDRYEMKFRKKYGHLIKISCSLSKNLARQNYVNNCIRNHSKFTKTLYCNTNKY